MNRDVFQGDRSPVRVPAGDPFVQVALGLLLALLVLVAIAEPLSLLGVFAVVIGVATMAVSWRALSGERTMLILVLIISVFMLDAVFRVRSYSDKSIDFQIALKAGTWLLLLLIAVSRLGTAITTILSRDRLLWTLMFGWLAVTCSFAPNPLYALVAAFSLISFYLFFAALAPRARLDDILTAVLIAILLLSLVSLIVYVVVPSLGRTRIWVGNSQVLSNRLAGIAGNANSIGRICCLGLIITAVCWQRLKESWRFLPYFSLFVLGLTLLLSNSRTSILVAAVVIILHVFARARNMYLFIAGLAAMIMVLLLLLPFSDQILVGLSRSGRADELATGTSRTLIWHVVSMLAWQKPLFGWGYGSTVFLLPQYEHYMGHAAPHAHNIILQLWITTGFVGVGLFLLAIVTRFVLAMARGERIIIALLLFVILNGLTESSAFGGIANITSVALILAAVFREPTEREL